MKLWKKLIRKSQSSAKKTKCGPEPDESEAAAQYTFGMMMSNNNPPMELMHPQLCMYLLTKEVAETVEFEDLIQALRTNDCLTRIHVQGSFLAELSVMQQHLFWQVVCQVPTLRSVAFLDFNHGMMLKASLLKMILEGRAKHGQRGIQDLEMSHVVFQGDLTELSQTLRTYETLESVVVWDMEHVNSSQTNAVLQMLVGNRYLKRLFLGSFHLDEPQIAILAKALSQPGHQLQVLRLIGCSKYTDNSQLHRVLPGNRLTFESCVALAEMLKVNECLQELELTNLQLVDEQEESGLIRMVQALHHHNRTLKSFKLFQRNIFSRHDITPAENDALVAMLQENHVLTKCLPDGTGRAHDVVQFYLKLNRCKLRGIQADLNLSRDSVVQVLEALDNDVDCIYHVLRDNPCMMQL